MFNPLSALGLRFLSVLSVTLWLITASPAAEPLPNTKPLTDEGDLAAKMVAGIHKYLDRELAASPRKRDALWKADLASKEALAKSLPAKRAAASLARRWNSRRNGAERYRLATTLSFMSPLPRAVGCAADTRRRRGRS